MTFFIRNFNQDDFQRIRDWTAQQHWNPGVYDFLAFKTIDKQGFWVGVLDGQPITAIAAVQYNENFAYVGMYFTKPEFRGKGYGIKVWKKALSRLTAKNIGLQATPQQQLNYMKSRFRSYHKILRQQFYGLNQQTQNPNLLNIHEIDFEKLVSYDKGMFFTQRALFLQKWINLPQSKSLVFIDQQKQIQGYGVLRVAVQGYTIGPLFAESFEVASEILKGLRGFVDKTVKIFMDVPDINKNAMKLVKQEDMKGDLVYKRMYTDGQPQIPMSKKIYGITSCEFG